MTEQQKKIERLGAKLDPALKGWIDRVIVPGMVLLYRSQMPKGDVLKFRIVPNSASHELSAEVSE